MAAQAEKSFWRPFNGAFGACVTCRSERVSLKAMPWMRDKKNRAIRPARRRSSSSVAFALDPSPRNRHYRALSDASVIERREVAAPNDRNPGVVSFTKARGEHGGFRPGCNCGTGHDRDPETGSTG